MSDAPSMHAANCRLEECDWSTLDFSMPRIYADLEDHLKNHHDYSEQEWRDARDRLVENTEEGGGGP